MKAVYMNYVKVAQTTDITEGNKKISWENKEILYPVKIEGTDLMIGIE